MTPKEKARELIERFSYYCRECDIDWNAKQFALISVNEMIKQNGDIYLSMLGDKANEYYVKMNNYLFEVKQEIEKL